MSLQQLGDCAELHCWHLPPHPYRRFIKACRERLSVKVRHPVNPAVRAFFLLRNGWHQPNRPRLRRSYPVLGIAGRFDLCGAFAAWLLTK